MTRKLASLFCVGVLAAAGAPVASQPTSLVIIPIADTVGAGRFEAEMESEGTFSRPTSDELSFNTEFGIGQRVELGIDFSLGENEAESRALFNAKYVFAVADSGRACIAAGIESIGLRSATSPLSSASPYLVASRKFSLARLHFGGIHTQDGNQWFVGADRSVSARVRLMAEHTSGRESFSCVGFAYELNEWTGVQVGAQVPNGGGDALLNVQLEFEWPGGEY